ncbi:phage late control D family protein [Bosea thiooxidans]
MAFALDTLQQGHRPFIHITVNGQEVSGAFYSRLVSATFRDEAGQSSDKVTFTLDDAENAIELPPEKATIVAYGGWIGGEQGLLGTYEMQSVELKGDADEGEFVVIQASAADLKSKLKGVDREHFEEKTIGEIAETIAKRNGMTAKVDPELAKIKIPYRARIDTSEIDFLTTLADEHGGVVKPMGDRLVVSKRGAAKSTSGKNLAPIAIDKSDCKSWSITPNGRAQYGKVKAGYIDQKTGKRVKVDAETGLKGPDFTLKSPYPTKELAEKAAQAEAQRLTRNTGEGHFQLARGRFDAQAEADVIAGSSFRTGIAGTWRCDAVDQVFDENGWTTRVEVKSKEDGSSGKKKEE